MDVTPQLLHDVEFREAKRGGYNTQDVDEFLERLAVGLERQDAAVREARQRIEAAESRVLEAERRAALAEQRAADTSIREAEEEAAATLAAAQEQSARLLADAEETSARARAEAEDEVRRAHQEARAVVMAEMRELEAARDQLRADVDLLEHHLEEQRERLRQSVHELQLLLEDPGALRPVEVPVVSDVTTPQPEPVAVAVEDVPDHGEWEPEDAGWEEPVERARTAPPASAAYAEIEADDDEGPPTEAVDVLADRHPDDDAYLAELRKAMTDETPLGPRDEAGEDGLFDQGGDAGRSRFGRRR
jgi:DivIVA domain-containing protein